jgi:hypothetical protein
MAVLRQGTPLHVDYFNTTIAIHLGLKSLIMVFQEVTQSVEIMPNEAKVTSSNFLPPSYAIFSGRAVFNSSLDQS